MVIASQELNINLMEQPLHAVPVLMSALTTQLAPPLLNLLMTEVPTKPPSTI